jgi:hypothetical protein
MLGLRYAHPFGQNGPLRLLGRLAAALVAHGPGVVLHRAGECVLDRETFLGRLGDLEDGERMPWDAWVDFAVDARTGGRATMGLSVFALPELVVAERTQSEWSARRAIEALSWACATMVRENRELVPGEALVVPLATVASAERPRAGQGPHARYRVEPDEGVLLLRRVWPATDEPAAWLAQAGRGELVPKLYEALFDDAFARAFAGQTTGVFPADGDTAVPHKLIMRRDARGSVLVATNGLGRIAQPGGAIELVTCLPQPSLELAAIVGSIGAYAVTRGPDAEPVRVFDRLQAPLPELDIGGFLVDDGGKLELGAGRSVQLLALVPVTAAEYAEAQRDGTDRWLARELGPSERLPRIAARWTRPPH